VVLLTNGQISVGASNISDVRTLYRLAPLAVSLGNVTTNQTINCSGASSVNVNVSVNTSFGTGPVFTLTNLQIGVPVKIAYFNNYTAANAFSITFTTPAGLTYAIYAMTTVGNPLTLISWSNNISVANGFGAAFLGYSTQIAGNPTAYMMSLHG
jgi:hypothetical protein